MIYILTLRTFFNHSTPGCRAFFLKYGFIIDKLHQQLRQRFFRILRNEPTAVALMNGVGNTTGICSDNRRAACLRLNKDETETFDIAEIALFTCAEDEQIVARIEVVHLAFGNKAEERHIVVQSKLVCQRFESLFIRAFTTDFESYPTSVFLGQPGYCREYEVVSLEFFKSRNRAYSQNIVVGNLLFCRMVSFGVNSQRYCTGF